MNLEKARDASFNWQTDLEGVFYSAVQVSSAIIFVLYSTYFVIVAYSSFF